MLATGPASKTISFISNSLSYCTLLVLFDIQYNRYLSSNDWNHPSQNFIWWLTCDEVWLQESLVYVANGLLMLVSFFFCRVMLFPYLYYWWGTLQCVGSYCYWSQISTVNTKTEKLLHFLQLAIHCLDSCPFKNPRPLCVQVNLVLCQVRFPSQHDPAGFSSLNISMGSSGCARTVESPTYMVPQVRAVMDCHKKLVHWHAAVHLNFG